jgi:diguanylate cyclase (GGDEF)-like protein/PAS domain S-box-containing protein
MNDLMLSLNSERSGELDYEIYDGKEVSDKTLMYDSDKISGSTTHKRFQDTSYIDIAGHTWTFMIGSIPAFDARLESHRASLIAENGIAISLLLTLMTWLLVGGRQRAYTLAREMNLELIQSSNALQQSESHFRVIVESQLICIVTVKNRIIQWANPAFEKLLGYEKGELNGVPARQVFTNDETYQALGENAYPLIDSGKVYRTELEYLRKDGSHITAVVSGGALNRDTGESLWACVDITQRKRSELAILESEERFRFILRNSPIAVRIAQLSTSSVVFANHQYSELIGVNADDVLGVNPRDFYANPLEYDQVVEQISNGDRVNNKLLELTVNRDAKPKWVLASYLKLDYEKEPAVLGWFYDISDRKAMEERAQYLAHYDALVDIPNRLLFSDRLQRVLVTAKREKALLALMFIDLDKFKPINDAFGHHVGDLLLKEAAKRMQECVRESDTVARIGGDEFVILLPTIETEQDAILVAEKIRCALNLPFELEGRQLNISSSTGVVVYPDHGVDETQLVRNADVAMYYAKEGGRNAVVLFRKDMQVETGRMLLR